MLSHGLTTGGLFLGIGILYERRHTRRLAEYGGLWKQMPVFSALYLIVVMGSAGLPGLSGFVGEFLSIFGTFNSADTFPEGYPNYLPHPRLLGAIAATGVIVGAVYLLFMFQKVFFGPLDKTRNGALPDLTVREKTVFIPLVILIFVMGVFPRPFLKRMEPSVNQFLGHYHAKLAEGDGPARLVSDDLNVRSRAAIERIRRGGATGDAPTAAPAGRAQPGQPMPVAPTRPAAPSAPAAGGH
jgi:NADH-quinone oxidoreductase subunit M